MQAADPIDAFSDARLDVVILGAGPAGAGAALALKRIGIEKVLMVDWPRRRGFRIGESAAPGIGALLGRLGLDHRLERLGHRPCHGNLSFWGVPSATDFFSRASGSGWHLDRAAFDEWLRTSAQAAGARLLAPARLLGARRQGDAWRLLLGNEAAMVELSSRWVLDATGRAAASRRFGARLHRIDRLIALATIAQPASEARFRGFTIVEAAEMGWWYGARLPDGRALVALMTDADIAQAHGLRDAAAFRQVWAATAEIRGFAPPPAAPTGPPVAFSAATQYLDPAIGPGWLALGDALMAFDPLSASGITGALEDAIAAADVIAKTPAGRGDERPPAAGYALRARATLEAYLAARRAIYASERRWYDSLFWRRRIAAAESIGYHGSQEEEFAA